MPRPFRLRVDFNTYWLKLTELDGMAVAIFTSPFGIIVSVYVLTLCVFMIVNECSIGLLVGLKKWMLHKGKWRYFSSLRLGLCSPCHELQHACLIQCHVCLIQCHVCLIQCHVCCRHWLKTCQSHVYMIASVCDMTLPKSLTFHQQSAAKQTWKSSHT